MMKLKKGFSLLLAVLLAFQVLSAFPALGESLSVQMTHSPQGNTFSVGEVLHFSLSGNGTTEYVLQAVDPDSRQTYYQGAEIDVPLDKPGKWAFIGYGANGSDPHASGFERCQTATLHVSVSGGSEQTSGIPETDSSEAKLTAVKVEFQDEEEWFPLSGETLYQPTVNYRFSLSDWTGEDFVVTFRNPDKKGESVTYVFPYNPELYSANGNVTQLSSFISLDEILEPHTLNRIELSASQNTNVSFQADTYSNEMRYVNRFVKGTLPPYTSAALYKWLDCSEKTTVSTRQNSGYLCLDEENLFYNKKNKGLKSFVNFSGKALDYIGSLGISAVTDLSEESSIKKQFPKTGSDGLAFYMQFSSLLVQYVQEAAFVIGQTGEELQAFSDSFDNCVELGESIYYISAYDKLNPKSLTSISGNQYIFTAIGNTDKETRLDISIVASTGKKTNDLSEYRAIISPTNLDASGFPKVGTIDDYFDYCRKHQISEFRLGVAADSNLNPINIWTDYKKTSALYKKHPDLCLDEAQINHVVNRMEKNGSLYLLPQEQQDMLLDLKKKTETSSDQKWGKFFDSLGIASDAFDTVVSWVSFSGSLSQAKEHKKIYLSALFDLSLEYLTYLKNWRDALSQYESSHEQLAMKEALDVIITDFGSVTAAIVDGIDKTDFLKDQKGNINDWSWDVSTSTVNLINAINASLKLADTLTGKIVSKWIAKSTGALIQKMGEGAVNFASSAATFLSKVFWFTFGCNIGSLIANAIAANQMAYSDDLYLIHSLKAEMADRITLLFSRYQRQPTHELACEIISMLNLLKSLKQSGERLVLDHYLAKFIDDYSISTSSNMYGLFINLFSASNYNQINIPAPTALIAVYRNYVTSAGDPAEVIEGFFSPDDEKIIVNGKELQTFVDYVNQHPDIDFSNDHIVDNLGYFHYYYEPSWLFTDDYGNEYILSNDEYPLFVQMVSDFNTLLYNSKHGNAKNKAENQLVNRIDWYSLTNRYIEYLPMYDSSKDYR